MTPRVHVQFDPDHLVAALDVLKAQPLARFVGTDDDRMVLLLLISKLEVALGRYDSKLPSIHSMCGIAGAKGQRRIKP